MEFLDRTRFGPVVAAVAAAVAVNVVVFAFGFNQGGEDRPGDPPGWLIGAVWILLFALFGASYAALARAETGRFARTTAERLALVGLIALCLAYPFYTGGFASNLLALTGNALTAVVAARLVLWFWPVSRAAALLVAPVLPWIVYATFLLLR